MSAIPVILNRGDKFGRLTVIGHGRTARGEYGWECKCDCGSSVVAAVPASAAARDCRLCAIRAARRDKREGYDTWRARDLDRLIATLGTLAATLSALDESRRALLRAESAEVADLTQRKATA